MNLLSTASVSSIFNKKFLDTKSNIPPKTKCVVWIGIFGLLAFDRKLHVYLDQSDDHTEYVAFNSLKSYLDSENYNDEFHSVINNLRDMDNDYLNVLTISGNRVFKGLYGQ